MVKVHSNKYICAFIICLVLIISAFSYVKYNQITNDIFYNNGDASTNQFLLGAYFYPWYNKKQWNTMQHPDTPQAGLYDSSDNNQIKRQLNEAKSANINFLLYSWTGIDTPSDKFLKHNLLPNLKNTTMNFVILYEAYLSFHLQAGKPLDFNSINNNGDKVGDVFVKDMKYIADTYFSNNHYQKIDKKPMLFVYLVRDFKNSDEYLTIAKKYFAKKGIDVFLIADVVYWQPSGTVNWDTLNKNYNAITGYNMYGENRNTESYLQDVDKKYAEFKNKADKAGLYFIPNVQPGYDDRKLRGAKRPYIARSDGEFYKKYWNIDLNYLDRSMPIILLTSFNEWYEGTEIEPSSEYGNQYINLTNDLVRSTKQNLGIN